MLQLQSLHNTTLPTGQASACTYLETSKRKSLFEGLERTIGHHKLYSRVRPLRLANLGGHISCCSVNLFVSLLSGCSVMNPSPGLAPRAVHRPQLINLAVGSVVHGTVRLDSSKPSIINKSLVLSDFQKPSW